MLNKNYSFNLDTKKHKNIILWIEKMRDHGDLNFSALMRRLLINEMKRQIDINVQNRTR